jgi:hypothetical protein
LGHYKIASPSLHNPTMLFLLDNGTKSPCCGEGTQPVTTGQRVFDASLAIGKGCQKN